MAKILKSTHGDLGTLLHLGNCRIPCYVLEPQRAGSEPLRVIPVASSGLMFGPDPGVALIQKLVSTSAIRDKMSIDAREHLLAPLKFLNEDEIQTEGFEAAALMDLCNTVVEVAEAEALPSELADTYARAQSLRNAVAKVGLIALIDEATGYQKNRHQTALRDALQLFLAEEIKPWVKTFPDRYYERIYALKGWDYLDPLSHERPQLLGRITNDLIYARLHPDLVNALQTLNPLNSLGNRDRRHHQHLSNRGYEQLRGHLYLVVSLLDAAQSWQDFIRDLDRLAHRQLPMPLFDALEDKKALDELDLFRKKLDDDGAVGT